MVTEQQPEQTITVTVGQPPTNNTNHQSSDLRLHLALFLIQGVCAMYNTLCQLFLTKDSSKDDWREVLVFSLYRDLIAAPVLFMLAYVYNKEVFAVFPRQVDFPRVLSQAFLGIFCNQLASLLGIQLVGAVMASLVHLATPMFAGAIAVWLGQEKLNSHIATGVLCACVGAMSMSLIDQWLKDVDEQEEARESSPIGIFALFVGSFASAIYYNLQKITLKKKQNQPLMVTAWEYALGAMMMLLCALICVPFGADEESAFDANKKRWVLEKDGLYALFFAVVFNSILKYALSAYCNKRAGVTLLTVYSTTQPVVTAVLALVLLNQPLRWGYVGAFAILYGVWLVAEGRERNRISGKVKYDDSVFSPTTSDALFEKEFSKEDVSK